jgi:hypothetical protein
MKGWTIAKSPAWFADDSLAVRADVVRELVVEAKMNARAARKAQATADQANAVRLAAMTADAAQGLLGPLDAPKRKRTA